MTPSYRIVFMGTPEFAVPALKSLSRSTHRVLQVVTQPDRPKGRGKTVVFPPVKEAALDLGCPIIQPQSVRTQDFCDAMTRLAPDLLVVAAYGHVLPQRILAIPKFGAVNIHASLLPKYRGAAPIQWAVINREKETGVTLMLMDKGLDTGDMLSSASIPILSDDTSGYLHDRLALLGADLLIQTLNYYEVHRKSATPQVHEQATYAPILKKEDGHLDWHRPADELEARIRGLTPWPGAFCFYNEKRIKIYRACQKPIVTAELPGTVLKGFSNELAVATGRQALIIQELQGDSGKRLPVQDFLRGHPILPGVVLK
ncbi:MAG: methionyl-tRNA formyltransferase [Deltaproteobacteria bacterium]|nr:methionyl-tRNA formyltransferase [Deltaproteobacteria bacterium]